MRKGILAILFVVAAQASQAQLEIAKLVGKNSSDYGLGYGGFLKVGYPLTVRSDVSLELGVTFFFLKAGGGSGIGLIPLKAGYRYVLNPAGTGFYIEPQLGYNIYGGGSTIDNVVTPVRGPILSLGAGYLFKPAGKIQIDLGLRYESLIYNGGSVNYFALRVTHNFSLKIRDTD